MITPVRDEALHVMRTIDSLRAQTVRPASWILVNDGSRDATGAILDRTAIETPWIHVVHRPDRGHRANGSGVMEAFYAGYELLGSTSWDYLVKLDADLSFGADYFERSFAHFLADPTLGIGGGTVMGLRGQTAVIDSKGDPPFHVRGATKIYRRACWEAITPLLRAPGWDTIDEVKANMLGWSTRTFPDVRVVQHKPTGSADGGWRNAFKNGRANYVTGYDPIFMLAKCVRRAASWPPLTAGLAMAAGFASGYCVRAPRVPEASVIRYIRKQQRRRLTFRGSIYG